MTPFIGRMRPLALLVALCLPQLVGCVAYPFRGEAPFEKNVDFTGISRVSVDTRNGSIQVRCEPDRKDVEIRAIRYASGTTVANAREEAERIDIEIAPVADRPDTLRIAARFPLEDARRNRGVRFEIALPPDVSLDLSTRNGRVETSGAKNDVDIQTSNGSVAVSDLGGSVTVHTSNGAVEARDVSGDVDLKSSNGHIVMERVGRSQVRADTSNGRIRALQACGNVKLISRNGSIEYRGAETPEQPTVSAVTSNGSVLVELPRTVNATLRMRTSNGRVATDLKDVAIKNLEQSKHRLSATLNKGGGEIDIESSNGTVTFRAVDAVPAKTM